MSIIIPFLAQRNQMRANDKKRSSQKPVPSGSDSPSSASVGKPDSVKMTASGTGGSEATPPEKKPPIWENRDAALAVGAFTAAIIGAINKSPSVVFAALVVLPLAANPATIVRVLKKFIKDDSDDKEK
jgi:hypothetical protein